MMSSRSQFLNTSRGIPSGPAVSPYFWVDFTLVSSLVKGPSSIFWFLRTTGIPSSAPSTVRCVPKWTRRSPSLLGCDLPPVSEPSLPQPWPLNWGPLARWRLVGSVPGPADLDQLMTRNKPSGTRRGHRPTSSFFRFSTERSCVFHLWVLPKPAVSLQVILNPKSM